MQHEMRKSAAAITPLMTTLAAFAGGAALTWYLGNRWLARQRDATDRPVSDAVLIERVRVRMAHLLPDPDVVEVTVDEGVLRLAGELAPRERDALLSELIYVPGVRRIRNALGTPRAR